MVTHIVIFNWKAEVTPEQVEALAATLDRLAADLAQLTAIRHGSDLRFRDGNGDYALVATFADRAGWDAYQAHPLHEAFVRDMVTPILATRHAVQF